MYILTIIFVVGIYELFQAIRRDFYRAHIYQLAEFRAKETNKKVLVIGDPHNGKWSSMFGAVYGPGDTIMDLKCCPICQPYCIEGDIHNTLQYLRNDSYVIFICCTLSYVERPDYIISELYRIAGRPEDLFVHTVQWYSLTAYLYSDVGYYARNIIYEYPPYNERIKYWRYRD